MLLMLLGARELLHFGIAHLTGTLVLFLLLIFGMVVCELVGPLSFDTCGFTVEPQFQV